MSKKEVVIISLGGSLVVPEEIDVDFLKNFKLCLEKFFDSKKFFIITGGGKTARKYQAALAEFGANNAEKDWAGIDATRMNARVVKQVFAGYPQNISIGSGTKPGHSTDYVSVKIAKKHKSKTIINLSNIDYVYNKNPKEFPDAKPLKEVDWKSFERIVGSKWFPGLSMPFDPRASKIAAKMKLKVVIINGKNLERLEDFLNNKPFVGTTIG